MLVIFSRIITKVINMICGRTDLSRISCPFGMFAKRLSNIFNMTVVRVITPRKLNIRLNPINKEGDSQDYCQFININNSSRNHAFEKHSEHTKYKEVTPSEFNRFDSFIKSILQLAYGFNLHFYSSHSYNSIMTSKSLKSYLFDSDIYNCLGYSGKKSSVLRRNPR